MSAAIRPAVPDRSAAMKAALEAYQARQAAEQARKAAEQARQAAAQAATQARRPLPAAATKPATPPPQPLAAFVKDTARATGLSERELTTLFKAYDRQGSPAMKPAELDRAAEAAVRYMAAKPPAESAGWLATAAGWLADEAGDQIEGGLDAVGGFGKALLEGGGVLAGAGLRGAGADGLALLAEKFGQGTGAALGAQAEALGKGLNDTLDVAGAFAEGGRDPAAELAAYKTMGAPDPAYVGEIDGALGSFTNRLSKGESVFLSLGAKATLPAEALGFPNVEGGVTASAALKRTEDGKIALVISGEAAASANYELSAGFKAKLTVLGTKVVGAEAGAYVKGGIEASASAELTLSFDPKNPADVARLRAILEPGEVSATNPGAMGLNAGRALKDAMDQNFGSVEVGGRFGASADAKAYAELGVLEGKGGTKKDGAGAGIEAGLSAKGGLGLSMRRDRDGSTTQKFRVDASLAGSANLFAEGGRAGAAMLGGKASTDLDEAFVVKRDRAGQVIGLGVESTTAAAGGARTEVLTKQLTAAGLATAQALIARGATPYEAFRAAEHTPANLAFEKETTTRSTFTILAATFSASLGAKAEIDVNLSVGSGMERVEQLDAAAYRQAAAKQDAATAKLSASYYEAGKLNATTKGRDRAGISAELDVAKGTIAVTASDRRHLDVKAIINPNAKPGENPASFSLANKSRPRGRLVRDEVRRVQAQKAAQQAEGAKPKPAAPAASGLKVQVFGKQASTSFAGFTRVLRDQAVAHAKQAGSQVLDGGKTAVDRPLQDQLWSALAYLTGADDGAPPRTES